jgi:SAM-dependent methyltransferase
MHSPAAPSTPGITPAIQHSADHPALALSGPAPTPNGAPKGIPKGLPAVLFRVGYTAENLTKVGALPRGDAPGLPLWELLDRATGDGPLEVLARVFLLAQSEKPSLIANALAPDSSLKVDVDAIIRADLLEVDPTDPTRLRAVAGLVPLGEKLILRDFPRNITGHAPAPDHVLAVGGSSALVAQLTPRTKVSLALDLGTGQGFQAILASAHADRVIATDVNPRALRLATTSCALNAVRNVELRLGSLYEPVADLAGSFDLIVSNPPFVIAPPQDIAGFSDAGLSGHALVERVVRDMGTMLAPGGVGVLVANWAYSGEEAAQSRWSATPSRWLQQSTAPVDAAVLHFGSYPARAYAFKWLEETGTPRDQMTPDMMHRWMQYYASLNIDAVAFGAIMIRRCLDGQTPIIHCESAESPAKGAPCADTLLRTLLGVRALMERRAISEDALGAWKPKLTSDAVLTRLSSPMGGAWRADRAILTQRGGLPREVAIDGVTADLLATLDGTRSVDDAGRRVARSHGLSDSPNDATRRAREVVSGLARLGYFEHDTSTR